MIVNVVIERLTTKRMSSEYVHTNHFVTYQSQEVLGRREMKNLLHILPNFFTHF